MIRMLHTLLGEENFQKGMQLYFERHDGSAATCDDFVQAMEDASNVDLSHSASGTASPVRQSSPCMTTIIRRPSSIR